MSEPTESTPWFRNFWPWFVLALLLLSMGASLTTVVIAFRNVDVGVVEDRSLTRPGPRAP